MAVRRARPLLGDTRPTWAGLTLAACVIVVVLMGLLLGGRRDRTHLITPSTHQ